MNVTVLDAETVYANLPPAICIELVAGVQQALTRGEVRLPLRTFLPVAGGAGSSFGIMPGELTETGVFGAKLISVYPDNPAADRPAIQGTIVLFDAAGGAPVAVVDAPAITALRTAAASGAATRALARPEAATLALLGAGVQAASHLDALRAVRPLTEVRVWSRTAARARAFAEAHDQPGGPRVAAVASAEAAVTGADIVCTVTAAREPVLRGAWLEPGCHVNLVGAHTPTTREADTATLARARVFTEITEFALAEAGDILLAIADGAITEQHVVGEIGAVLAGTLPGRVADDDITLYKNLGNTAQDLVAAHHVVRSAAAAR